MSLLCITAAPFFYFVFCDINNNKIHKSFDKNAHSTVHLNALIYLHMVAAPQNFEDNSVDINISL